MSRYLIATFCVAIATVSAAAANEVSGHVRNLQGEPVSGATVFISTAGPRDGVAIFCPSCYLDCGKKATTDAEGRFTIADVDPSLVFHLVATADGYRAGATKKRVDPANDQAYIELETLPADLPPERVLRGRVVDADGKPVVGAEVRPFGARTGNRRWWGGVEIADAVAITNREGRFIITSREPADAFDLELRSPRHAAKNAALVPTGAKEAELQVETGVIVRGRVLSDGKPVPGASVGLAQCDRSSETFLGEMKIGTDVDGKFQFTFVPPNDDFYIYTTMTSMKGGGAMPLKRLTVGKSNSLIDLGDVSAAPAYPLAGRIVLTDSRPLPGKIQTLLSREGAWDSQQLMVEGDGRFRFENVPGDEPVTIHARVPGYQLASGRNRFQQVRENGIAMFVEGPREDIEIFFEPVAKKN
jgi:hypothetical protein